MQAAGAGGCTTDPYILDAIDSIVTNRDTTGMLRVAKILAGPVSSVSVVTDPVICHRAAIASGLSRDTPDSLVITDVSVIRVGPTRYVVTPVGETVGEFDIHITFDSAFTLPPLAVWAQ